MADVQQIKAQRDRFLAFSFASADLFIETEKDGSVIFALGSSKSLTGFDEKALLGRQWLELFSPADRTNLIRFSQNGKPGRRWGPLEVRFADEFSKRSAIVSAIRMPEGDHTYVTVSLLTDVMARMATINMQQDSFKLLNKDSFLQVAREALEIARSLGCAIELTLLEIPDCQQLRDRLGRDWWANFIQALGRILGMNALDGKAASEIQEGRYCVIHDQAVNSAAIREQIVALAKKLDPSEKGFSIHSRTISGDLRALGERDATKAVIYTISEFQRLGLALTIDSLNNSFPAYAKANAQKIQQFRSMVETLSFDMFFQPVIDLESRDCLYFEMLARFRGEESAQEWVILGEDIGMSPDFDIAVCERALNYLQYKSQGRRSRFAINLSGRSIQSDGFLKAIMAKLAQHKGASERLVFEITDSSAIQDLTAAARFIHLLRSENYKVCLDDFGTSEAALQCLDKLGADYLKIDNQYTRKILHSERDRILVRNLVRLCEEKKIPVLAEKIENVEEAAALQELGIGIGQGFLYGKPMPKPDYSNV
jgi:EAL domain-containing protein (putative c-di-GMP-specific phosphodiesterase class I)